MRIARLVLLLLLPSLAARAWMRPIYQDETVVARAELIVVGRIVPGSIVWRPHPTKATEGRSWEYRATLRVAETLKGVGAPVELPIVIRYGLDPVVGGYVKRDDGFMIDLRGAQRDYPKDRIAILDVGNSAFSMTPLVPDAGEDNLWFLRHGVDRDGAPLPDRMLGISDPEDLQPIGLKRYFLAYLSPSPGEAVTAEADCNPAIAARARRYLDHLAIESARKKWECAARVERLVALFLDGRGYPREARSAIVECGAVAGPRLTELLRDPTRAGQRQDLIALLGETRYSPAVDVLGAILEQHDRFWATQQLEPGWWNRDVGSEITSQRREIYGEVYAAVIALDRIDDRRAAPALVKTRARWRALDFENPQIVESCDGALRRWER